MGRTPIFSAPHWYDPRRLPETAWADQAACANYRWLPWTADRRPARDDLHAMATVCAQCPVTTECARYALRNNKTTRIEGGMYAGVWLPWPTDTEDNRYLRRQAGRFLRGIAGLHSM